MEDHDSRALTDIFLSNLVAGLSNQSFTLYKVTVPYTLISGQQEVPASYESVCLAKDGIEAALRVCEELNSDPNKVLNLQQGQSTRYEKNTQSGFVKGTEAHRINRHLVIGQQARNLLATAIRRDQHTKGILDGIYQTTR